MLLNPHYKLLLISNVLLMLGSWTQTSARLPKQGKKPLLLKPKELKLRVLTQVPHQKEKKGKKTTKHAKKAEIVSPPATSLGEESDADDESEKSSNSGHSFEEQVNEEKGCCQGCKDSGAGVKPRSSRSN